MSLAALDCALKAVRTYLIECADREPWDRVRTAELNDIIRRCVERIGARDRGARAALRPSPDAIEHAIGYVDERLG